MANKKIVIAEDERALSTVITNKLRRKGFDVIQALDGAEAVQKIKAEKPDLVLLDLIMPNKDGFQVLEEVKGLKTKVVVFSNLGQESDIERAKGLGAKDFLVKSNISIEDVVKMVNKYTS